jgi:hypothetical protein
LLFPGDQKRDYWPRKVLPFWKDTLAYADYLVRGMRKDNDPCKVRPRTWGGPMDRARALRTGLYPILCRSMDGCTTNSCNDGYTTLRGCWVGGIWACDPSTAPQGYGQRPVLANVLALNVQSRVASR